MTCINYKDIGVNGDNKHTLYLELWDEETGAPSISAFDDIVGFPKAYTEETADIAVGSYVYNVTDKKLYFYDGTAFVEQ